MQESWVFILFIALVAAGVLLQGFVLLGMLIAMRTVSKRMEEFTTIAEQYAVPAFTAAKSLLDSVSPKLKTAAENVAAASETLRNQSQHAGDVLDSVLNRTEAQAQRVDEMMTDTLNAVADATAAVQRAVIAPVRQVQAVLNGLRAGLDVLRGRSREAHAAADGENFV